MDYEAFKQCVKENVAQKVKKGGKVIINHILKNNGMELDGLVIMEKDSNVAPTIYLNSYYDEFQEGRAMEDIVDNIIGIHNKNKANFMFNPDLFNEYENIRQSIVYKVINYEKNKKLLKDVPHKRILDLAVVYYCLIEQSKGVNATALIHNEHLQAWGITDEKLYDDAIDNTPRLLKSCIKPMSRILSEMAKDLDISEEFSEFDVMNREGEMYVLTNKSRVNGAACMLYEKVLEKFADAVKADLYILPSSIHEVIILPKIGTYDKNVLVDMVREVNVEGVSADEVLSDNVYEYRRKERMIIL